MSSTTSPIVEGKYEVLSKIREGGMGAIYLARHRLLDELRVIKVMRPHMADKESDRKRFLREAQTATRLKHPNIATLYDFAVEEDGALYMVLEFIDGINLKDLVGSCGVPPVSLAVEIARQSLAALGYLHRAQVVHRDISPDNLMLASDESGAPVVKLIDLGIARHVDASDAVTADGSFIGKLQYCSPEQLRLGAGAKGIDIRSDLFSFGLVFYELLTGQRIFKADAPAMLLAARNQAVPLDFEEKDPQGRICAALRSAVARAVQLDREARFPTAEEFASAVQKAIPAPTAAAREEIARYLATARDARPSKSFVTLSGSADQRVFDAEFGLSRPTIPTLPTTRGPATSGTGLGGRTSPTMPARRDRTVQPPGGAAVAAAPSAADMAETALEPPPQQARAPKASARSPFIFFAAIAVVVLAVAGGIAVLRYRPTDQTKVQPKSGQETPGPAAGPAQAPPASAPEAVARPTVPPPPPASPRPAALAQAVPQRDSGPRAAAQEALPLVSPGPLCLVLPKTTYSQEVVKAKPAGFATDTVAQFRAPRTDSARITIVFRSVPASLQEGSPFRLEGRLRNDGDMDVDIARIEEMGSTGWRTLKEFAPPRTVQIGGSYVVFQWEGQLDPGKSLIKDVRVIEDSGDTWAGQVRVASCP